MDRSTGSLVAASDGRSGSAVRRHKTMERPRSNPDAANIRYGAGPTLNLYEGADMAQSTRGPDPSDRQTRNSGVNITPLTRSGPVTSTLTVA